MKKITATIIESEENSKNILKSYICDKVDIIQEFETQSDLSFEKQDLNTNILFINIDNNQEKTIEFISKIYKANNQIYIIAMGTNCTTDTIIKIMRAGAKEFLPKPIIENNVKEIFKKLEDSLTTEITTNKSKVITVFSNKGGIGKTSIASNLALELTNITTEKVALVDLNMQLGDVCTFLNINPSFNISYVANNLPNENSETFLLSTLEKYKKTNLYILADAPQIEKQNEISTQQISKLFEELRKTFSYIIVDTSNVFDEKALTILDNTDFIMLVSIVNLPAIRNCQRCLNVFEELGYDSEKTKIVVNRYMENDEVKIEDLEKALDKKVFWKIPNNYFTIMSAINKGVPTNVINPESNIAQSYRELATILADNIYKQKIAKKIVRTKMININSLMI